MCAGAQVLSAEQKTITRKMVLPHDAAAFTQKEFKLWLDENFGPGAKIITFTDSDGDDCTVETMQGWRYMLTDAGFTPVRYRERVETDFACPRCKEVKAKAQQVAELKRRRT